MILFALSIGGYAIALAMFGLARDGLRPWAQQISRLVFAAALTAHLGSFVARYAFVYRSLPEYRYFLPVSMPWEAFSALGFGMMAIIAGARLLRRSRTLAIVSAAAAMAALARSWVLPHSMPILRPAYQTLWMGLHGVATVAGYVFLAIGCAAAVLCLTRIGLERSRARDALCNRFGIASAEEYCMLAERFINYGFPLMTLGMIFRSCWANLAWGWWWGWTNEELWSLAAWLCYLIFFHLKRSYGTRYALIALAAICAFVIGFIGYFTTGIIGYTIFRQF